MFRLFLLLMVVPSLTAAEWFPTPRAFSYDATFARCTLDAPPVDPQACSTLLRDAFVLNRAVAVAVAACDTPLSACTTPFEDAGLPAIAARIASDSGCDDAPAARHPVFTPLPDDHCITIMADILRDEGVVPLDAPAPNEPQCTLDPDDCFALAEMHSDLWATAVRETADTALTRQRTDVLWNGCIDTGATAPLLSAQECYSAELAAVWADLVQHNGQDQ